MNKAVRLFRSEAEEQEYINYYDKTLELLPVSFNTQYVQTTFGETYVIHTTSIDKPTLVLLHCQGFSSIAWYYNIKQLSQHFEIYCIDSVGEPGKTKSNRTYISNSDYAAWLFEVFLALGIRKPNLAGWSFGGLIAAMFALHYPQQINSLVLMSPAGCIAPISNIFFIKLFAALITGKEVKINLFLKWISGKDNNDYPNPVFTLFTYGMKYFRGWAKGAKLIVLSENEWKEMNIPILILIGENDPIYKKTLPQKIVDKINRLYPNIIAETIPGSHGFPILNADIVNKKLISFCLKLDDNSLIF